MFRVPRSPLYPLSIILDPDCTRYVARSGSFLAADALRHVRHVWSCLELRVQNPEKVCTGAFTLMFKTLSSTGFWTHCLDLRLGDLGLQNLHQSLVLSAKILKPSVSENLCRLAAPFQTVLSVSYMSVGGVVVCWCLRSANSPAPNIPQSHDPRPRA